MYKILDKEFKSKSSITDFVRIILHNENTELSPIDDEYKFMMELFTHHPDYNIRIKDRNVIGLSIGKDIHYGTTKCFFLIYDNKRRIDISYTWCIKNLIAFKEYDEEFILTFGKYKGQSIYDVPVEYIEWCVKESINFNKATLTKMNRFLTYGKI